MASRSGWRRWALVAWTPVLTLALVACSDDDKRAKDLCNRQTQTGQKLLASYPTSVGTVRGWTMGDVKPAAELWKAKDGGQFAAWCWFQGNGNEAMVAAVSDDGGDVIFATGTTDSLKPNPDGP